LDDNTDDNVEGRRRFSAIVPQPILRESTVSSRS
jgi:hypothetical protein